MTSAHMESRPPLAGFALLRTMADNWWLVLLRGLAAIAFGILAFAWPVITLLTLTLLWGAYAVADGLFDLWGAAAGPRGQMGARFWLVIVGIAGVIAGLLAFAWPGVTALVLLFFIAVWAIVIGIMQIWGAIQLRKDSVTYKRAGQHRHARACRGHPRFVGWKPRAHQHRWDVHQAFR